MKAIVQNLSKKMALSVGIIFVGLNLIYAQTNVNLDNPKIYYDGVLFPIVSPTSVVFNRHTPSSYSDPSSGIVYAPCNLTRATQSGVRIRFKTASPTIKLSFAAQTNPEGYFYNSSSSTPNDGFTVSVNGAVIKTFTNTLSFTINHPNPSTSTEFEVNLPTLWSVQLVGFELATGYSLDDAGSNTKPKYAAFGTSISMGTGQNNSTQTYPYLVSREKNWNLFNFAVAGSSLGWQLAYNVKGKQFDVISVEQGFNNWASQYITTSLAQELALYGRFVDSLRKFQPMAKIYCIAPIATTYNNATPRYSLDDFRNGISDLVNARKTAGDKNIYYINGASISNGSMTTDGIHLSIPGAAQFASALSPLMSGAGTNKGYIPADDSYLQYSGRIDFSNPIRPTFSYPGVSVKANFQGTSISVIIKDYATGTSTTTNYFNVIIDKGTPIVLKTNNTDTLYNITTGLSDTDHSVEIFKRTESSVGKCEFRGLRLATGKALLSPNAKSNFRIEFIGDSYTCGYGNEVNIPATGNPNTGFRSVNQNNYNAWGAIASRNLNAEYVCTAYSGRGLYRNNTGSTSGTIPKLYDQIIPDQTNPKWDPNRYVPNIVVVHLGTNDFFPVSQGSPIDSSSFVSTYINFIIKLRGYYPAACIICAVPNGLSDFYPAGANNWTRAKNFLSTIVNFMKQQGDSKVYNLVMTKQGSQGEPYGEDYHPSLQTHQIMANDLVTFINTLSDCSAGNTIEKVPSIILNDLVKTDGDAPFLLNPTSPSTGAMTYSIVSGGTSASVSANGTVTILSPGSVIIKVEQAAASGYTKGMTSVKLTILSRTAADTIPITTNIAKGNNGSWSTQVDAIGSKVNSFTQVGPVSANFTQVAKTGANWPWIVLSKNVAQALTEMTYLKVTYTCNLPVQVALPQAPLSLTGENFMTTLPESSTPNTVLIPITSFAKPTWSSSNVALNLSKITSINFVPIVSDPNTGGNASIEIQSLTLYKSGVTTGFQSDQMEQQIKLVKVMDSEIMLHIPSAGEYEMQLVNINGTEMMSQTRSLSAGELSINVLPVNLSGKMFILKIGDNKNNFKVFKVAL